MSRENVELARWAFVSGDPTRFFSLLDEDVEFDATHSVQLPGAAGEGRGRGVIERFGREYWGTWAEYSAEPREFIDAGDDVVVEVHERGKGKGSGVPFERTHTQVWTLRDGRLVRWMLFADRAAAFEALGLSDQGMSQENVEITRQTLDDFNRGDREAWLAAFDPDAVMVPAREWPENEPIRGAEAIWDFYVEVTSTWEEGVAEFGEVLDAGDGKIVANNRRDARGRMSGAGVEFSYWTVSTFRDRKVVRMEWFGDRSSALEAVGLPE